MSRSAISAVVCLFILRISAGAEPTSLTVEVKAHKDRILLCEPLCLTVAVVNSSGTEQVVHNRMPSYDSDCVTILIKRGTEDYQPFAHRLGFRLLGDKSRCSSYSTLRPGERLECRFPILYDCGKEPVPVGGYVFDRPGKFSLKVIYTGLKTGQEIESNQLELEVLEPPAGEKEALKLYKGFYQAYYILEDRMEDFIKKPSEEGIAGLRDMGLEYIPAEEVVFQFAPFRTRFKDSAYAPYALLACGKWKYFKLVEKTLQRDSLLAPFTFYYQHQFPPLPITREKSYQEAVAIFSVLHGNSAPYLKERALFYLADLFAASGESEKAEKHIQEFLREFACSAWRKEVENLAGYLRRARGIPESPEEKLKELARLHDKCKEQLEHYRKKLASIPDDDDPEHKKERKNRQDWIRILEESIRGLEEEIKQR